jgi:hypothetical protein
VEFHSETCDPGASTKRRTLRHKWLPEKNFWPSKKFLPTFPVSTRCPKPPPRQERVPRLDGLGGADRPRRYPPPQLSQGASVRSMANRGCDPRQLAACAECEKWLVNGAFAVITAKVRNYVVTRRVTRGLHSSTLHCSCATIAFRYSDMVCFTFSQNF